MLHYYLARYSRMITLVVSGDAKVTGHTGLECHQSLGDHAEPSSMKISEIVVLRAIAIES